MKKKMTKTARMFNKGGAVGGKKPKGMTAGGKMPMVTDPKTGEKKPFFMVDGQGKKMGGQVEPPKTKGYFKGGKIL